MPTFRLYGPRPHRTVLVHGGPGARGELAPVARILGKTRGIVEAIQNEISIEGLIEELDGVIDGAAEAPVVLVGHSWGAWLALIYAERFPAKAAGAILVSSGPWTEEYAVGMDERRFSRMAPSDAERVRVLLGQSILTDDELSYVGRTIERADFYCPIEETESENGAAALPSDGAAFAAVWAEARLLRQSGELLRIAAAIRCPIRVIHGADDVHPFQGVVEPLRARGIAATADILPRCGHKPWGELYAREAFYGALEASICSLLVTV